MTPRGTLPNVRDMKSATVWNQPSKIVAHVSSHQDLAEVFATFDPTSPSHRTSLAALSDRHYAKLVKEVDDLGAFARAAYSVPTSRCCSYTPSSKTLRSTTSSGASC